VNPIHNFRIIGCGNRDRGDDAVGLIVADRLREMGLPFTAYECDPLGLLHQWSPADEVVLIDAIVTGAPPGTVQWSDGREVGWNQAAPASSHGFDVAQAFELARIVDRLPAVLRLCGIEAERFEMGSGLSTPVREAAKMVIEQVRREFALRGAKTLEKPVREALIPPER